MNRVSHIVLIILFLFRQNVCGSIGQTTIIAANTYMVGNLPINSLAHDSSMTACSSVNLPTGIAMKQYVDTVTKNHSNWDLAFTWGNPSSFGYITASSTSTLTNKSGNISQWTNNAGFITGISGSDVTSALGYTPYNSTNPSGYISSIPAQTFVSLTGKPTTLAGYGITDAYPLSSNPANFLTSIPAQTFASLTGKPTTISGYGITDAVTSVGLSGSDLSISGSPITSSGTITANLSTTGVSADGYNGTLTVDNKGRVTTATKKTFNASPGRSISTTGSNNTFTISPKDAMVSYTINFSVALVALASNGQIDLDYSLNAGSSWNPVSSVSQVYGLATVTTSGNQVLMGLIPGGALVRINRVTNTNITITISPTKQQEVND